MVRGTGWDPWGVGSCGSSEPGPEGESFPFWHSPLVPRDTCAPSWRAPLCQPLPHRPQQKKSFCSPLRGGDSSLPSPEASQPCTRSHEGLDSWAGWEEEGVSGREMKMSDFTSPQPLPTPHPTHSPWQTPPALGCVLVQGREGVGRWAHVSPFYTRKAGEGDRTRGR